MIRITTHVLDTSAGRPAAGLEVRLERPDGSLVSSAVTGQDGRVADWLGGGVPPGRYRLVFATGAWFRTASRSTIYPEVVIDFETSDKTEHYHLPLLVAPFGYSTYRGS